MRRSYHDDANCYRKNGTIIGLMHEPIDPLWFGHDQSHRGRFINLCVLLLAAFLFLCLGLVLASPTRAVVGHEYLSRLTETTPGESLEAPGAMATDPSSDLWVVDLGKGVVDEFDSSGKYLRHTEGGPFGTGGGSGSSIAVAANGDLYVADTLNGTIDVYSPTGAFLGEWNGANKPLPPPLSETPNAVENGKPNYNGFQKVKGNTPLGVAIDWSTGDVYVASAGFHVIDKFNAAGEYMSQIVGIPSETISMAVSGGELYALSPLNNSGVEKFDASGKLVSSLDGSLAPPGSFRFEPSGETGADPGFAGRISSGLALDSAGDLFVVNSRRKVVDEFSSSGAYLGQIGGNDTPEHHLFDPGGVAVGVGGDVYLADFNPLQPSLGETTGMVDVFGPGVEQHTLAVSVAGGASFDLGGGSNSSVLSSPPGIEERWGCKDPAVIFRPPHIAEDCPGSPVFEPDVVKGCEWKCSAQFAPGAKVVLSESASTGFRFKGWSEACSGVGSCEVTLVGDASVGAEFEALSKFPLTVHVTGSGGVVSAPPGIECPSTCSSEFYEGQKVKLTAKADSGWEFVKWTGCEAEPSVGVCEVVISKATEVEVEFKEIPQRALTVTITGSGSGTVISEPPGINCPGTCSHLFNFDEKILLKAKQSPTSKIVKWVGCESEPSKKECSVTLSTSLSVTVEFEEFPQKTLGVSVAGSGSGVVRSEPPNPGIECGMKCSHAYNEGAIVELVAQPIDATSVFQGWSGAGCSGTGPCIVTLGEDSEVTATFVTVAAVGCPNQRLRGEQSFAGVLPDCRAFEMVSPVDKNGNDAIVPNFYARSAVSGEAVTYESKGSFSEPAGAQYNSQYLSRRGEGGWTTRNISPPTTPDITTPIGGQWEGMDFTGDLSKGMVINGDPPLTADAPAGYESLYVSDIADGSYRFVAASPGAPYEFNKNPVGLDGTSADLSHVIFGKESQLFEWVEGHVNSVSNDPAVLTGLHSVSGDGSRVFFTDLSNGQLFLRENQSTVVEVSKSQRAVIDPHGLQAAQMWGASADGSRVFFTSKAELTEDANTGGADNAPNLYEYDVGSGVLTDMTVDHTDVGGAGVEAVAAMSEDGSYVYFVANGVLAVGGAVGQPVAGQSNLYVRHAGITSFIATLSKADMAEWAGSPGSNGAGLLKNPVAVTPDGSRFAFQSNRSLTGYDNRDETTGEPDQGVYLYDALVGRLVCVSCNPSGARPIASSALYLFPAGELFNEGGLYKPRNFSDDGKRLFFDTADSLVKGDSNGLVDVYEYENGFLSLISDGTGSTNSYLQDVSASGNDVFFATADQLVNRDQDDRVDVYDARVGGGFPAAPPPFVGCENEELCRPLVPGEGGGGVFGVPASASFTGAGNIPVIPPPPVVGKKVVKRALSRVQLLGRALGVCRHKSKGRKRTVCEKNAYKRYGSVKKVAKRRRRGGGRS